jgi:hypothetical protein
MVREVECAAWKRTQSIPQTDRRCAQWSLL